MEYRTMISTDICTGAVCDKKTEKCGVVGSWGAWSAYTKCEFCGGQSWRWRFHSCQIDANGKPAVEYDSKECVVNDPWSAWGMWSTNCPTTFPAACVETTKSRTRTNKCGKMVNGQKIFEQTNTEQCARITQPAPKISIGECSHSCIQDTV